MDYSWEPYDMDTLSALISPLRWRHNERDGVSNHQPRDRLLTVYSGADQRKHQSSTSLAFVRGIHRWPVNSPHKWPVARKMFPFDDVIMCDRNRPIISEFASPRDSDAELCCFLYCQLNYWTNRRVADYIKQHELMRCHYNIYVVICFNVHIIVLVDFFDAFSRDFLVCVISTG